MRLIDADALKEELRNSWIRKAKMPMEADPFLAFAMSDIDNAPTIDAEPVVRCKDCRHASECHQSVLYTRDELNTMATGYSLIEWCSKGERVKE